MTRRTKIVATIGPASESAEVLRGMVAAGMCVARLNASHSAREALELRLDAIRAAADAEGVHVAVMLDLGGPKVRLGQVAEGAELVPGGSFELVAESLVGSATRAGVTYPDLWREVGSGDRVLLDDGHIELVVTSAIEGVIKCSVVVGGPLRSSKGVNLPGVSLEVDALTAKDREDLAWGLSAGIDLVAQSFVRSGEDVTALRALMGEAPVPIVAKVEKHEAVALLPEVIEAADAVMVARGDLGVETSPEAVPVIQREVVSRCRGVGKPVVVATQMLESMTRSPRPTRAEASDVANAIFSGVDAVMLSAETAIGEYPVESVATMARIAETAEASGWERTQESAMDSSDVTEAVSAAACALGDGLGLAAVLTPTQSGATARAVARHRPRTPIVATTSDASVARRLALVWGVTPILVSLPSSLDSMLEQAVAAARDGGLVRSGEMVALTAGLALNTPGATDSIQVRRVP